MQPETVRRHRSAIRRALDCVCAQADSSLRLDRIADAAAMSPYHFAHVYEGYVGEPLIKTMRRRRLRQAEAELAGSSVKISAVARSAGYASGQAFARAYKRLTGLTPSDLRGGTLDCGAKTEPAESGWSRLQRGQRPALCSTAVTATKLRRSMNCSATPMRMSISPR